MSGVGSRLERKRHEDPQDVHARRDILLACASLWIASVSSLHAQTATGLADTAKSATKAVTAAGAGKGTTGTDSTPAAGAGSGTKAGGGGGLTNTFVSSVRSPTTVSPHPTVSGRGK